MFFSAPCENSRLRGIQHLNAKMQNPSNGDQAAIVREGATLEYFNDFCIRGKHVVVEINRQHLKVEVVRYESNIMTSIGVEFLNFEI